MLRRGAIGWLLLWITYEIWTIPAYDCVDLIVLSICGEYNKLLFLRWLTALDFIFAIYLLFPFIEYSADKHLKRNNVFQGKPRLVVVNELPEEVSAEGQFFASQGQLGLLLNGVVGIAFIFLSEDVDIGATLALFAYLLYVLIFSRLSVTLWVFDRIQWYKHYLSLLFGYSVSILLMFIDINAWLIHDVGYIPEGDAAPYFGVLAFLPFAAAYFDSEATIENAFYKSKGYFFDSKLDHHQSW
ncbi:hypothetical protein AT746_18435 [Lacimicrobium alkaliphilum]|uniref:Uncharacterized protein n=2 Tax=Lacimicrobium alkaliphilum TaxID=1526571 RepID=A0A0U2ZAW1_9ALTE|nr:hypothetical protein AT746_18435 [Lacimicrobium alkaliphilum]